MMRHLLAVIEQKKKEFSKLPLFEFMRDKSWEPRQRLAFAPCAAQFVMSFADLNKYVFRDEPTTDPIQEMINQQTYEDDYHWNWFLEDLEKLGLSPQQSLSDTLRSLWSDECRTSRLVANELYRLAYKANSIRKLIVIEATEATGNTMLAVSAQVIQDLTAISQQEYQYFGNHHLKVDAGHTCNASEAKRFIEEITLTEAEEQEYLQVIDEVFAVFTEFTNELLTYAQQHLGEAIMPAALSNRSHREIEVDYLIVGAGPAGLQLGYFLEQANHNYLILESGQSPGTSFKQFPRHRQLISINKRYSGYDDPEIKLRWDWNSLLTDNNELLFTDYSKDYFPSADALVEYLYDFAERFSLKIQYDTTVTKISKAGTFQVVDHQGHVYHCQRLIIATGVAKPYLPNIPGIELAENYTKVSVDPEDFNNQKVLIIGKGNSGFETADNLVSSTALIHAASPNPINMAD
jgi:Pyridine nucleotide-disulphide oxidoreductase